MRQSEDFYLTVRERLVSRGHRLRIKLTSLARRVRCCLAPSDVLIVGCYDTSNVGDLAMGMTLARVGRKRRVRCGVCGVSRLPPVVLRRVKVVIVGGGGVLTTHPSSPFPLLVDLLRRVKAQVLLVGVDGLIEAGDLDCRTLDFLRQVRYISARSVTFASALSRVTGRRDIRHLPDLAFAMPAVLGFTPPPRMEAAVGVNTSPQLCARSGRVFAFGR